jgi:hypothetical protein
VSTIVDRTHRELGYPTAKLAAYPKSFHNYFHTMEDAFHGALLAHLYDPARQYPLPGLYRPGMNTSQPFSHYVTDPKGDAEDAGGDHVTIVPFGEWAESRGSTNHQTPGDADLLTSRYTVFHGKALNTFVFQTDVSGEADIWIFNDPTDLFFPVYGMIMNPVVAGNYTDLHLPQIGLWDANPYPFNMNLQPVYGDNADRLVDAHNMYYTGGSYLEVTTLNPSAFLSVSYQTRTGTNVTNRFMQDMQTLWNTDDHTQPLNLLDQPVSADGAVSIYSGCQWHLGARRQIELDENGNKFHLSGAFRRCWAMGAPWIRIVARTTSAGVPTPGSVQINVRFHNWVGIAPVDPAVAGSSPMETVPFQLPTWMAAVHTRGTIYHHGKEKARDIAMMQFNTASRLPQLITGSSPLIRSVAREPVQTMVAAAENSAAINNLSEAKNDRSWWQDAGDVASGIARAIGTIAPLASLLL